MAKDYIPHKDTAFFNWQSNVVNTTATNALAWNIPALVLGTLQATRTLYEAAWEKARNKDIRNKGETREHRSRRKAYEKDLRLFVSSYLAHNPAISGTEKMKMRLTIRTNRARTRPPIHDTIFPMMRHIGGNFIGVTCRRETDENRSSMHQHAHGILMRYKIDGEPPNTVDDCTHSQFSTRARFIVKPGEKHAGKKLYAYFRWENTATPHHSSPWCTVREIRIV